MYVHVFSYFPFGFEGRIWDLIVSVPYHCLSFYFDDAKLLESGNPVSYTDHTQLTMYYIWLWLYGYYQCFFTIRSCFFFYYMICSAPIGFHCVTAAIKMRSQCRQGRTQRGLGHTQFFKLSPNEKCVKGMQGWGEEVHHIPHTRGNSCKRQVLAGWGVHNLRTGQIHAEG